MRYLVTGCAGFIGSNLIDRLLSDGHKVIGVDNFSTGKLEFLKKSFSNDNFDFHNMDLSFPFSQLTNLMEGCDTVFHLAAHADIKNNSINSSTCFNQNINVTYKVLEAMKIMEIKKIVFSSTGSVYGETNIIPTPETAPLKHQTSIYSATKLSCEAMIEGYCETYGISGYIFRFVSVLGPRYHHGHVYDFYKQLLAHPDYLEVLGNGNQTKSYLHVSDCVEGMLTGLSGPEGVNTYNLGTDETIRVKESIDEILCTLNLNPRIKYGTEERGWIGDNPLIYLDCSKIRKLGWEPEFNIRNGIHSTLQYLKENEI